MNCVLALAGAEGSVEIGSKLVPTTWKHYSLVLRDLQQSLSQGTHDQTGDRLRLLLVTLFLGIVENLSGNSQMNHYHLKASRQLVLSIMATSMEPAAEELRVIWGFLLELYSYRALIASITPLGALDTQAVIVDPFLNCLQPLSQFETYGFNFGCDQSVFEFIPEVSQLTSRRSLEEQSGNFSLEANVSYALLESRLRSWTPACLAEDTLLDRQKITAAMIYQNALLIYLHSSFCDPVPSNSQTLHEMEFRAHIAFPLLQSLASSMLASIMLWPMMMICSCLRQEELRKVVREAVAEVDFNSMAVTQLAEVLELLWEDDNPRAYGPRGLDFIMKKKGWSICMT